MYFIFIEELEHKEGKGHLSVIEMDRWTMAEAGQILERHVMCLTHLCSSGSISIPDPGNKGEQDPGALSVRVLPVQVGTGPDHHGERAGGRCHPGTDR